MGGHGHKFNPEHVGRLLKEERYRETPPDKVLRSIGLKTGHVFADVGCGPGFYSIPASEIVGPNGRVWAVDTEEKMLAELSGRSGAANITALKSGESAVPIPDGAADVVLAAYVLHECEDLGAFLKELRRILKDGGRLVLFDWSRKRERRGPPMGQRLTRAKALRSVEAAGFRSIAVSSLTRSHFRITARK